MRIASFIAPALAIAAVLTGSSVSFAGGSYAPEVRIVDDRAFGTTTGARNSADALQFIGCATTGYSTATMGWCQARDETGRFVYCSSSNEHHLAAIQGLADASRVFFSWDGNGRCVTVQSVVRSDYLP